MYKYKQKIKNYPKKNEKNQGIETKQKNKRIKTEIQNKKLYMLKLDKNFF